MASYFWVGGTGTYDGVTNHFATSSGGTATVAAPTSADDVTFDSNSNATAYTLTVSAVLSANNLTMGAPASGALTWAGASAVNVSGNFSIASGSVRTTLGTLSFLATSGTKTITPNGVSLSSIVLNGSGATFQLVGNLSTVGNITLTAGAVDFTTNTTTVTISGITQPTITGNFTGSNSFYNLTMSASASLLANMILAGNITCTNSFVANGNSTINRLLISSNLMNTPRTITAASVTVTNSDFRDITGAGAGSWDLHAITGLSGDAGGNSGITFTTPATQHWTNTSGGNWGLATNWTSRIPLPQDNVVMDAAFTTARTVTVNMVRLGAGVDWTGATWTTSLTFSVNTTTGLYGSLKLISGLTWLSANSVLSLFGRGSFNIQTFGVSIDEPITVNGPGGTYTLVDALTMGATRTLTVTMGTLDTNGLVLTTGLLSVAAGATLTLHSETDVISGTGSVISMLGTLNAGTSTINVTGNAPTITGNSVTYYNMNLTGGGIGYLNMTGETFNNLAYTGIGAGDFLQLAGNPVVNGTLTVTGASGANKATVRSSSGGVLRTVTFGGASFTNAVWSDISLTYAGGAGTWALAEDLILGGTSNTTLTVTSGTFDANNFNVSAVAFSSSNANTRSIRMRSGTWSLPSGSTTKWNIATITGLTFDAGTSTIKFTDTSVTAQQFMGGGLTYYNLWISRGTSTASVTIVGNNTFNSVKDGGTAAHSLLFTAGSVTTISNWSVSGSSGNVITLNSTTTATFSLVRAFSGRVPFSSDWLNIQHSVATPANMWYAGANSVNNQGVASAGSGWIFTVPPVIKGPFPTFFQP